MLFRSMETLADSKARFGELLRQNGAESVIEAAVLVNRKEIKVIKSLLKVTMLFGISIEKIMGCCS